jgi:hypothetical protein
MGTEHAGQIEGCGHNGRIATPAAKLESYDITWRKAKL